jgi:ATP-dependent DNA helicase PIF1
MDLVMAGRNVFFTGSAGTGKSFLLKRLVTALRDKYDTNSVFVTASTGIAACAIDGVTVHR